MNIILILIDSLVQPVFFHCLPRLFWCSGYKDRLTFVISVSSMITLMCPYIFLWTRNIIILMKYWIDIVLQIGNNELSHLNLTFSWLKFPSFVQMWGSPYVSFCVSLSDMGFTVGNIWYYYAHMNLTHVLLLPWMKSYIFHICRYGHKYHMDGLVQDSSNSSVSSGVKSCTKPSILNLCIRIDVT